MTDAKYPVIHTKPGEKIVTYFCTRNLYHVLPAAYNSLLAFNPDVHVYCFVEDTFPPIKNVPLNVTFVNVTGQTLFPSSGPCYNTKYTYMILLKAALTKIFPDAERAVVLDVDTIVCDSIEPLWTYDLTYAHFAAVTEPEGSRIRGIPYPNFGVVLLNLARLRSSGKDDAIISEVNTIQHPYPEQDAFASVCGNRFDPLPPDYNVTKTGFDITGNPSRTIIRHFAGLGDWADLDIVRYWLTHTKPYPRYVVYAGDHRVYDMMSASLKSLLYHSPVDKVFFLIEHDTFPSPLPSCIECINVSKQSVFDRNGPNIMTWYSFMTTLRAGLTKILPPYVDRVLWLDPDTVVVDDISDIWNTDLQNRYFAAVEEVRNHNHSLRPYFNAGVMLMDLHKFRSDGMDDRIIDEINTVHYEHLEQDVLNYLCFQHVRKLPACYSASYVSEPCEKPKIKHFLANDKPFFGRAAKPYADLSWDEIMSRQHSMNGGDRL